MVTRRGKRGAQLVGTEYPVLQPALADLPPFDMRAVSEISGITIGALNVQFTRRIYPWMETAQQGRARRFDPNFAMHLAVTGALMRLGMSVYAASSAAVHIMRAKDLSEPGLKAVVGPAGPPVHQRIRVIQAQTLADIEQALETTEIEAFIVVDVNRLLSRVIDAAKSKESEEIEEALG